MKLDAFKAWLRGYESRFMFGRPNAKQWAEIKRVLATVEEEHEILIVTPNSTARIGDMKVVALDADTYRAIANHNHSSKES